MRLTPKTPSYFLAAAWFAGLFLFCWLAHHADRYFVMGIVFCLYTGVSLVISEYTPYKKYNRELLDRMAGKPDALCNSLKAENTAYRSRLLHLETAAGLAKVHLESLPPEHRTPLMDSTVKMLNLLEV